LASGPVALAVYIKAITPGLTYLVTYSGSG
jgi:hypothetical protein